MASQLLLHRVPQRLTSPFLCLSSQRGVVVWGAQTSDPWLQRSGSVAAVSAPLLSSALPASLVLVSIARILGVALHCLQDNIIGDWKTGKCFCNLSAQLCQYWRRDTFLLNLCASSMTEWMSVMLVGTHAYDWMSIVLVGTHTHTTKCL